jgi:hypothetical protein
MTPLGIPTRTAAQLPLVAVTGSQRPYIFDLPYLLSLPTGFEFRFRYRHRWVSQNVVRRVIDHHENFSGRELVVLFHSQDTKRLIPIRAGVVIGIESIGPMIFLRFRVGEFPRIDLSIESYSRAAVEAGVSAATELEKLAGRVIGPIGSGSHDLQLALPEGFYLREANEARRTGEWNDCDDLTAWARLAALLHIEPNLTGIPFFYVQGFRAEDGAVVKTTVVENRFSMTREEIRGFSLTETERYRMRVVEWSEPPKAVEQPRVEVHCDFNSAQLELEGASDLVVGRYDVIEFTFSARQSGYSEIALKATPLSDTKSSLQGNAPDAPPWTDWPAIFVARVPIVVRRRARRFVLPTLSLLVGATIYLFVAPGIDGEQVKGVVQLVGLGLIMAGYQGFSDLLEGIFKLSAGIKKLRGGPSSWSAGDA